MSGRACRERASVSNEETPSVPPLILMHSTVFSAVLYSRRRRRRSRRVQQYRPRVSVSDTQRSSLFTVPTGARPERNGVLSAGAEYSRRPINKTQRRKAKQRASRIFPRSRSLFLTRCPVDLSLQRDLRREIVLSHRFLPSYETRRTMRVSTLLPRCSRCSITGICRSCFTVAEKALLTRSRWVKVMSCYLYFLRML